MEEKEEKTLCQICRVCSELKLLTYFHRDKTKKLGRHNICKKCQAGEFKKYYKLNRGYILELQRKYRVGHKRKYSPAAYKKWCREHRDQVLTLKRKYYRTHKGQIALAKRDYRKTEKGRLSERRIHHRRRAREGASTADLTSDQWLRILKNQKYLCNLCGKRFCKSRQATTDHIIPLSKGGDLTSSNVQALCQSCNSTKQAKILKCFINSWNYP